MNFRLVGIHGDDSVALRLHVSCHSKTGSVSLGGEPNHGDDSRRIEQITDCFVTGYAGSHSAAILLYFVRVSSDRNTAIAWASAARNFSFSFAVPTVTRSPSGIPIQSSERTITPSFSSALATSVARLATSKYRKFPNDGTNIIPSRSKPLVS